MLQRLQPFMMTLIFVQQDIYVLQEQQLNHQQLQQPMHVPRVITDRLGRPQQLHVLLEHIELQQEDK
jgi:hypothetical protein